MRLNKYIARSGLASRRKADELTAAGKVKVNGAVITELGYDVQPRDIVTVGGKLVREAEKLCCYALNKPAGYVTTAKDDRGRPTVLDLLSDVDVRVYPVGRLDCDTSGLLLLTNDGEFAHKVISPKYEIPKRYYAETEGVPDARDAEAFARGIELRDGFRCRSAELFPSGGENCEVIVKEGKYHQVRRMLAAVGKPVTALRRLSIGALELENLPLKEGFCELSREQLELIFIK